MKQLRARDEMTFDGLKFPKPERIKSEEYLSFIRRHPCAMCFRPGPNEAHHLSFIEGTGQGTKPSDLYAIPLCIDHHRQVHETGTDKEYFAIVCCRLLAEWIASLWLPGRKWRNRQ